MNADDYVAAAQAHLDGLIAKGYRLNLRQEPVFDGWVGELRPPSKEAQIRGAAARTQVEVIVALARASGFHA